MPNLSFAELDRALREIRQRHEHWVEPAWSLWYLAKGYQICAKFMVRNGEGR